ncbi:hypothetical protein ES703_96548 [subsurface metagenome]
MVFIPFYLFQLAVFYKELDPAPPMTTRPSRPATYLNYFSISTFIHAITPLLLVPFTHYIQAPRIIAVRKEEPGILTAHFNSLARFSSRAGYF